MPIPDMISQLGTLYNGFLLQQHVAGEAHRTSPRVTFVDRAQHRLQPWNPVASQAAIHTALPQWSFSRSLSSVNTQRTNTEYEGAASSLLASRDTPPPMQKGSLSGSPSMSTSYVVDVHNPLEALDQPLPPPQVTESLPSLRGNWTQALPGDVTTFARCHLKSTSIHFLTQGGTSCYSMPESNEASMQGVGSCYSVPEPDDACWRDSCGSYVPQG